MYIPRLDEFTTDELTVLLDCIIMRELILRSNIAERVSIYERAGAVYPYDVPDVKKEHKDLEVVQLFRTQILNALGKVAIQEQINNN